MVYLCEKERPSLYYYAHYHALHVTSVLGGVGTGEFLSPENEGRGGAGADCQQRDWNTFSSEQSDENELVPEPLKSVFNKYGYLPPNWTIWPELAFRHIHYLLSTHIGWVFYLRL